MSGLEELLFVLFYCAFSANWVQGAVRWRLANQQRVENESGRAYKNVCREGSSK